MLTEKTQLNVYEDCDRKGNSNIAILMASNNRRICYSVLDLKKMHQRISKLFGIDFEMAELDHNKLVAANSSE